MLQIRAKILFLNDHRHYKILKENHIDYNNCDDRSFAILFL